MIEVAKQIWSGFVVEARRHWETGVFLPDVHFIDGDNICIQTDHILLHQKLCMLNCCILRKNRVDIAKKKDIDATINDLSDPESPKKNFKENRVSWNSESSWEKWPSSSNEKIDYSTPNQESIENDLRFGRKRVLEGIKSNCGSQLWEPITQPTPLMTEDMIEEQQNIMEKLGSNKEGQHLRAKIQSAQLISDMQAFKAANPGCVLEDFVKWHSPRDWILDQNKVGKLSERFSNPENMWNVFWTDAEPMTATSQKQLFDPEKEAERVLNYLEYIEISDVLQQILPTLFLISFEILTLQPIRTYIPSVCLSLTNLSKSLMQLQYQKN